MKKRFSNLCILAVGMLALLMYGKEKESTLDNEKNCLNSDNASKVVWEEIISSNGETYKVSFERISDLYDAESESYRYCADYQLVVRDSGGKDISKQIITNFPVWYEEAHWMADVSGDDFSDVVLCPFYEGYTRYTDLRFYIWNMDKSEYEEQPLSWNLWRPVWNEKLSCVIFIDKSYDDIRMKMISFENGEWVLREELLPGETIEETEEKVQFQCKEIFYTEEGNIENKIIVDIPEQYVPWNDVNSVWCDENSQNKYLFLNYPEWDVIDVEFEEGKSSPKYIRQKDCNVEETDADNEIDFYGVWHIDKAVLQSNMYTGTTKDGDFDFIPVGTQCVILNERTMFIGLWGKILLAHRIS